MISIPTSNISLVIDPAISWGNYMPLDLSVTNPTIEKVKASSSADWEIYINELLARNGKKIAFGGYLEKRNIYQRSEYFKDAANDRNIHLGIDFWIAAGTSVHAFTDGIIHSFQDNRNHGDYGPTIILEHHIDGTTFYSLYGHLSRESLMNLSMGDTVKSGQKIAELGDASVNGDYAPHLHFQLIMDLEEKTGDYPGVCEESEIPKYEENCPNPLPFFGLSI
ncbi:MAG: peptidase M23 [Fluviicola sp. XM-24bin1]|nr:MAG: peptidase M23 [Fluviicola sp. XM-24bin1]